MTLRPPRSLTQLPCLLALAWFALALAAQPVLVALADMHHAIEHATVAVAETAHDHADQSLADANESAGDDLPSALHSLLHVAHCCAQSATAAMPAIDLPAFFVSHVSPSVAFLPVRQDARRSAPYRPPINV
ncbi:MAG: hypothetical protein ABIR16_04370 [Dokdonella sp.]